MSQTAEAQGLQVSCAQPGCHWKGSPADAPAHDCPTPELAEVEDHPFAGILQADGLPIAEEDQDPSYPYAVVWTSTDGERIVRVGTRELESAALALAEQVDKTTGDVHVQRIGTPPSDEELTDAETKMTVDSEPETEAEIVAWLAGFGRYSDDGVPEDEKTAQLDARLSAIQGEEPAVAGADEEDPTPLPIPADPEPDLEEDEPLAAEGDPWEIKVAAELELQTGVASYRWLVVDTDAGEIIGRARVKSDAEELLEKVREQASADPNIARVEIVKTQAVIERAEELQIERRREMIPAEEPTEVDATPADEPTPDPEPSPEEAKPEEPEAKSPGAKGGGLFDASDFDREDLALPAVDGHSIDKIALDFSGRVMLDRGNPDHVALFRRAKIHADLELWIRGKGSGVIVKPNTNKDGDLDVVVSTRGLRVEAVRIVPAEELADLKDELGKQATDAHEAGEDR